MYKKLEGNAKQFSDILGRTWSFNCMGCAISKEKTIDIPGGFIYEDDTFTIQQDPFIPINGFIVVNVKRHINSITQLSSIERSNFFELVNKVVIFLKELHITKEITLVQEEISKHLHFWIFPNHEWMNEKFGKGINYLKDISFYAKENCTNENLNDILATVSMLRDKFNEATN